jgi:photosystem II stability/assembly factor-like uncharacterized protein
MFKKQPNINLVLLNTFIIAVFQATNASAQWIQQSIDTKENLTDVVMLDPLKAIAVGDRNGIFRTTDSGSTWINETIMLSAVFHWNSISFSDSLNGTIVGDQTIWRTTDGGIKWTPCTFPPSHKNLSVLELSAGNIYIGTDSGWIYFTSDSGHTWKSQKISSRPIKEIFPWTGTFAAIYQLPLYALTSHSICERGLFPGDTTWIESELQEFRGFGSEAFDAEYSRGGGPGFIVGVQGDKQSLTVILKKVFSDTAWIRVDTSFSGLLLGVSAPSANVIYACGFSSLLVKSTDGGDSWSKYLFPYKTREIPISLNAINFLDEKNGFAVGDSGTIYHTSNGGSIPVSIRKNNYPSSFLLSQNYPNPFNPITTIKYDLTREAKVQLFIYSILGKKIAELVSSFQKAGRYEIKWNAENYASGVYIYQIKADGFMLAKKLILLK